MNYFQLYSRFLKKHLKPKKKITVVFDCSNGTTGLVLQELFSGMKGVRVILINHQPDGNFPAHGPSPLGDGARKEVCARVIKEKADVGFIFDADGDRVFVIDNKGATVDPNEIAYLLMKMFRGPYVIGAVSSWRLQSKKTFVSRVGHYFFKKMIRQKKASLGLEHSGHYYFKAFFGCDSGIFAALQIVNFVSGLSHPFSQWIGGLPPYYRSGEINFRVSRKLEALGIIKDTYEKEASDIKSIDGYTIEFGSPKNGWWFNLRPSNTEDYLRLNIEATSQNVLKEKVREITEKLAQFIIA